MIFENENFAVRAWQKSSIFWNWTYKNIPGRQHSARFRKSPKTSISLHPTGTVQYVQFPVCV